MQTNAYCLYKKLNKGKAINVDYIVKLSNSERVEYIPNKYTVKIMLEHEDKYIYPYLVFNVDYGYYRYSNCVNYENEINLNKGFIIDDDIVNYRGIVKQEYYDYVLLKDIYRIE